MIVKTIQSVIQNLPGISAWEIRRWRKKSYQCYHILDQIESQRVVEIEKYGITLYKEYDLEGQKVLGESTVSLSEGDHCHDRLALCSEMAALVANPVFHLPEKKLSYNQIQTVDADLRERPLFYLDRIQDDLTKGSLEKVRRSSAEVFIEDKELFLLNSNGLEKESSFTEIFVDFILLAEKGPLLDGESQGMKRVRYYTDLQLTEMVQHYAQYAREAQEALLPQGGSYPVVFSDEALDTLFNFFVLQASGPACFQKWSHLVIGKPVILDLKGEALSLSSNPTLAGGMKSRSFDDNGLPLYRVEVIQNNIFQKRLNSKRYADYLQEEATGDSSNLEVAPGSRSVLDLLADGPCYHLLRFSTFEPNPITGAFSGEIRTGYLLQHGQKIPIKGGSVSGTIQQAFKEAYFSKERTTRDAYFGPEAVRIEKLDITGK
jgi:PmbA protein